MSQLTSAPCTICKLLFLFLFYLIGTVVKWSQTCNTKESQKTTEMLGFISSGAGCCCYLKMLEFLFHYLRNILCSIRPLQKLTAYYKYLVKRSHGSFVWWMLWHLIRCNINCIYVKLFPFISSFIWGFISNVLTVLVYSIDRDRWKRLSHGISWHRITESNEIMTTYILWLSGHRESQAQFLSYLSWAMFSDCNHLH